MLICDSNGHQTLIDEVQQQGMKHDITGCLEDNSPDSIILHVGTNNLKNKESVEDIANDIMDVAIFIRNEKNQCICICSNCPK